LKQCGKNSDIIVSFPRSTGRHDLIGNAFVKRIYDASDKAGMPGPVFTQKRFNCAWKGTPEPMIAGGGFGKSRVLAYTSDPAPHCGCDFVYWDQYNHFWQDAAAWLPGN
jgi:hypothetical protein